MARYSALKAKADKGEDDSAQERIGYERERALKGQQIEFQDRRVNELSEQLEKSQARAEERIRAEREELQRDQKEKLERLAAEKSGTDAKYEAKRNALKEIEGRFAKERSAYERE